MLFFSGQLSSNNSYRLHTDRGRPFSCKPQLARALLSEPGMQEALGNKLLISILAGVTITQLSEMVGPTTRVVRAMPNTPCRVSPQLHSLLLAI